MLGGDNGNSSVKCNCRIDNFWKPTLDLNLLDLYKPYLHEEPNETLHNYAGKYSSVDSEDLTSCFEEITLLMLSR